MVVACDEPIPPSATRSDPRPRAGLAGGRRFWQSQPSGKRRGRGLWTKRKSSSCAILCASPSARPTLQVAPSSRSAETADVSLGERKIGAITVDDEDGDRSFAFAMKVPVGRSVLQDYLRKLFENDKLTVASRLKKTDSVELNNGPEFLGIDFRRRSQGFELHPADGDSRHRPRRGMKRAFVRPTWRLRRCRSIRWKAAARCCRPKGNTGSPPTPTSSATSGSGATLECGSAQF